MTQYWLMKSEPDQFGIADLERVRVEPWTGVRNYMARLNMRAMQVGDGVLFHHSNADPPGVAGLARVVRIGVLDETQFDPASKYFDPKATREKPIWDCVDVEYVETFPHYVSLDRMRADPALAEIMVLRRGMRLSVQPVTPAEYARIVELGHTPPPPELAVTPKPPRPRPETATQRATAPRAVRKRAGAKAPPAKKPAAKKPAAKKPAAQKPAKKPAATKSPKRAAGKRR